MDGVQCLQYDEGKWMVQIQAVGCWEFRWVWMVKKQTIRVDEDLILWMMFEKWDMIILNDFHSRIY